MKLPWKPIIIIAVILLAGFGIWRAVQGVGGLFVSLQTQVAEVGGIADDAAAAVTTEWDPAALAPFATPDYLASLQQDNAAAWVNYKPLGTPSAIETCSVGNLNINNGRGVANATCKATFEKGPASLLFGFDNLTGAWKINSLQILL